MKISKECNLVLMDLYFYDIQACYYNLLKQINWNLDEIEFEDKTKRNIQIGLLQKQNPRLAKYLLETSESIIQFYIEKNELTGKDIIVLQRDGLISTCPLQCNDATLELKFRSNISKMIIDIKRKSFLTIYSSGDVSVKGVPNKPIDIGFYGLFKNLDFCSKRNLILGLNIMRKHVLESQNKEWFIFQKDDQFIVSVIGAGEIILSKSVLHRLDINEIDRKLLWDEYLWRFVQPLILYCA